MEIDNRDGSSSSNDSAEEEILESEKIPFALSSRYLKNIADTKGRRDRVFDSLLDKGGYGWFHVILIFVCGWALSSDSVEVSSVSFVIPVLSNSTGSLHPTSAENGALDSIIFLGMMVGGYTWGSWADIIGRRKCLISSLLVNGVFGLASALSPNFPSFLFFRFGSGVGVGGSLPVIFSYFSEFFSQRYRNPLIIILSAFWTVGRLYASILAWIIIPRDIEFQIGSLQISSWRIFLMLCTIPCLSSAVVLICLPESPGYLFSKNKYKKLMTVLKRISVIQCKKQHNSLSDANSYLNSLEIEESESLIVQKKTTKESLQEILSATVNLFKPPYLRSNLVMILIEFTLSFGYYGLVLWFPLYFKNIEEARCQGNCSTSVSFSDSQSYLDNLYVSLATIPGLLSGIFLINLLGSRILLAISMVVSALSTFLIWGVDKTARNVILLSCIFTGFSTIGWNGINVITPELFPVHLRSTAFGIQSAAGRIGAIAGTEMFAVLINTNPFLPILIISVLLIGGGLSAFLLPSIDKKIVSLTCLVKYMRSVCVNRFWFRKLYKSNMN